MDEPGMPILRAIDPRKLGTDMTIERACSQSGLGEAVAEVFARVTRDRIINMIEAIGMAEDHETETTIHESL